MRLLTFDRCFQEPFKKVIQDFIQATCFRFLSVCYTMLYFDGYQKNVEGSSLGPVWGTIMAHDWQDRVKMNNSEQLVFVSRLEPLTSTTWKLSATHLTTAISVHKICSYLSNTSAFSDEEEIQVPKITFNFSTRNVRQRSHINSISFSWWSLKLNIALTGKRASKFQETAHY